MATSGSEVGGFSSSAVLEASVVSTKIGSFRGSANRGSISAESNAWDSSTAPRADWDVILDNYEGTRLEVEYWFKKNMDCLPKRLMISSYGVFFQ